MKDSCVVERIPEESQAEENPELYHKLLLFCGQTTILLFVQHSSYVDLGSALRLS